MDPITQLKNRFQNANAEIWEDLKEKSGEENVENLIEEAEKCYSSGALRSAAINLWSADIEKIKWMLLLFPDNSLSNSKGLSNAREYNAPNDFNSHADADLIDAAEDIELLDHDEAILLQSIRGYIRNKCAHGDEIELDEETLKEIQRMSLDYIFEKTDSAGITVDRIMKIIEDGQVPERMLLEVENFSSSKQAKLANKLYDLKKNLPMNRMKVRENYLKNTDKVPQSKFDKRKTVNDCLDVIWPKLDSDIKSHLLDRAKNDTIDKEGARSFIFEYSISEAEEVERIKLMESYLEKKSHTNKEDVNDVAQVLALSKESVPELSKNIYDIIWKFASGDSFEKSMTINKYGYFLQDISEADKKKITDSLVEEINQQDEKWADIDPNLIFGGSISKSIGYDYIMRYKSIHSTEDKERVAQAYEESNFSQVDKVDDLISELRNND